MQERIYFDLSNVYQNLYQLDEQVEIDSDDIVVDYLISEGYTGSVEGAEVILSNMSEEWYNIIVEGLPKTAKMSKSEMASRIAELRKKQAELTKKFDARNPDPSVVNQLNATVEEIKRLSAGLSRLTQMTGPSEPTRITDKRNQAKKSPLTPEERADLKVTRTQEPTGTPGQRAQRRQNIADRNPSSRGSTPQTTSMNVAPVATRTRAQRRVAAAAQGIVGNMDPTYRDREGNTQRLNSQGESETNYGGRGRSRVSARYQQGASGSGTRGATPAGSTIDPDRPRPRRVR